MGYTQGLLEGLSETQAIKPERNPAKKRKVCPAATRCRNYFYHAYEEEMKRPYNPNFQKDAVLMHILCSRYQENWIKGMIDFFLKWDNEFVVNGKYEIGIFYVKVKEILDMNIHRSQWVKNHEQKSGFKTARECLREVLRDAKV